MLESTQNIGFLIYKISRLRDDMFRTCRLHLLHLKSTFSFPVYSITIFLQILLHHIVDFVTLVFINATTNNITFNQQLKIT